METTRQELPFVVMLASLFGFAKAAFLGFMGIIGLVSWNDVTEPWGIGALVLAALFAIASYALLTLMMAQVTGYKPGDFIHTLGDAHLYLNHLEQAHVQLSRAPRQLPTMRLNRAVQDIFAFRYEDFSIENYDPHPHIKAEVAV